ncbi:hypothetical protein FRC11_011898, partial [Ceratobasidium sp. 423]
RHLVAPRPPAWACHDPNYDDAACNYVKANWNNSFWRVNQTGAMQNNGFVPVYSVDTRDDDHVMRAVKFAGEYNLRLVVKNTGHDFLGRSSGEGSFSIWTHNLKGINFTDSFIGAGCPETMAVDHAVTIGAAEQWIDVYRAANNYNVTVVGGAFPTVGAAGGWVQEGGHSPLSGLYGLGIDSCIGNHYKTHPPVKVAAIVMNIDPGSLDKLSELSELLFLVLPNITDQGSHLSSPKVGST